MIDQCCRRFPWPKLIVIQLAPLLMSLWTRKCSYWNESTFYAWKCVFVSERWYYVLMSTKTVLLVANYHYSLLHPIVFSWFLIPINKYGISPFSSDQLYYDDRFHLCLRVPRRSETECSTPHPLLPHDANTIEFAAIDKCFQNTPLHHV